MKVVVDILSHMALINTLARWTHKKYYPNERGFTTALNW